MQPGHMWNARHDTVTEECNAADTTLPVQPVQALHQYDKACQWLPQHLCYMLPPYGILTADEMEEVVDLVLVFEDNIIGPEGRLASPIE